MKNNITSEIDQDVNIILSPLKSLYEFEKEFSINQLIIYLNIKRGYIDDIIEGISTFFKKEIDFIEEKYFYKVLNIFCAKLEENNLSTTKFISKMLPFLMIKINTYKPKKQKEDNILFNTITNFNVSQIELYLNSIFEKLIDENSPLDDNIKYALIIVLGIFIHNTPISSFYKIMKSSDSFKKIISDFKHKNKNIRQSVQILIEEFLLILLNKDIKIRKEQSEHIIYDTCIKDYIDKEDNNEFIIHGLVLVLKSFTIKNPKNEKQINEFFKDKFKIFLDFLYSNLSSQNNLIKISVIDALVNYCEILPNVLKKDEYLEYFKNILNGIINIFSEKEIDDKLKSSILKALGKLSLINEFIDLFSDNIVKILGIIGENLSDNKVFNENILECLSNFMTFFDDEIVNLLPFKIYYKKVFTCGLKEGHIPFFQKLLTLYNKNTKENIHIIMCLLNAISYTITQKQFNFKYSLKKLQIISSAFHVEDSNNKNNEKQKKIISEESLNLNSNLNSPKYSKDRIMSLNLTKSISTPLNGYFNNIDMKYFNTIGKIISEYIKDKKAKEISFSNEIKIALKLLGFIDNKYFSKDILNFYSENCIK